MKTAEPTANGPLLTTEKLVKAYHGRRVVDGVSVAVGAGEIVGLLGPNGAGKSTTMRILSGFLPATSGTVRVAGFDVFRESVEVRRRIGYMPENNPLYPEMRVREYLKYRARLKGLGPARCRERIDKVLQQCSLTDVSKKIIGHLSKGYRQRVGLADALVHEPELIILDEPTIGLDPIQIRAVRQLVQELGKTHTILISTHLLHEAELTCNRMIILREGKILAEGSADNLQQTMSKSMQVIAEIAAPPADLKRCWEELPEVALFDITPADGDFHRCALTPRDGADLRARVFAIAKERGWALRELTRNRHSLEDIYVRLTRQYDEEEN